MFWLTTKCRTKPYITSEEFNKAEKVLFKLIQHDVFHRKEGKRYLNGICALSDEEGIIRLKTRLLNQ